MSYSAPEQRFRTASQKRHMSAAQYRALRKELLILRSDVERLELAQAGAELRQSVTHFRWLKFLVPGVSGGSLGKSARSVNATLGTLVSQYPLLSSLASVVLAKPMRALLRASARPALKWGAVGFAVWEAYQIWKQAKSSDDASDAQARRDERA
ncbi:hypothetical protein WS62_21485 [Burkholderia sp. ABCPW 14]|uniref:DUF3318 domain-containing protein n=2 Tax=Burkholderiaceae TaxID=119060 RepID=A0A1B4FZA7_9BURK|nr:hypothetical protein WS71_16650 [Burkholderia mayonis]KVD83448.1 hypothetical protein WS62_21485 [Burkholderia sp. ABCPW 14]KVE55905.1 hypothetical protein WS71_29850 [Burkholderia mayonis]